MPHPHCNPEKPWLVQKKHCFWNPAPQTQRSKTPQSVEEDQTLKYAIAEGQEKKMCWNGYVHKWRIVLTTCHNSCVEPMTMRQPALCASHHQSALWLRFRDFVARILLVVILVLFGGWVGIVSFPFSSSSSSCTLAVVAATSQLAISSLLDGEQCGRRFTCFTLTLFSIKEGRNC